MPKSFASLTPLLFFILVLTSPGNKLIASGHSSVPDSCWVDSVFYSLSLEEKIGQLIIVRANKDNNFLPEIPELIKKYNIGGVCFFKGTPYKQAKVTNYWQSLARTPMFITIDGERGLGMRLDSTAGFPYMMTLGAMQDDSLVYRIGQRMGEQCQRIGIQVNFAPVVDINSNPANPVINSRSLGQDKENVSRKAQAIIEGMKTHGVMGTAKHFPGHGDTDSDSHHTLPIIHNNYAKIDSIDLYPYKKMIEKGLDGVMVAHLFVPALEADEKTASTLSQNIITNLLKKQLGFKGLIFTDALEMKGVTSYHKPGIIEVKALMAGNDILLMPTDVPMAVKKIVEAVDSCWIWPEDIDERVWRVLEYKHKMGMHKQGPIDLANLSKDLNRPSDQAMTREVYDKAITLIKNNNNLLPVRNTDSLRIACISLGDTAFDSFHQYMERYAVMDHFHLPKGADCRFQDSLAERLKSYNLLLMGIVNTSILAERKFAIPQSTLDFVRCIQGQSKTILALFGNPYAIQRFGEIPDIDVILTTYQDSEDAYDIAAQQIFGARTFNGRLPVSTNGWKVNTGITTQTTGRLQYVMPEDLGIPAAGIARIDSIIREGLLAAAYPGCQVAASYKGKVFYYKSFGYQDTTKSKTVSNTDLYDLASITKVAATTLAMMRLSEEKKIDLDQTLGYYIPQARHTNKQYITIRDILAHQAGLQPWIPFYKSTIKDGKPDTNLYRKSPDSLFSVEVADSLFLRNDYRDTILKAVMDSPKDKKGRYKYSDMGFILLRYVVENVTGQPLEEYVKEQFYTPLGMNTMGYRPKQRFPLNRIIPTEYDKEFRNVMIRGTVHDPAAAMFGGVAGHAGLFSDANDLLILMNMLVNKGKYAGIQFFKPETVDRFTACHFPENQNRRALGFDRPLPEYNADGPSCKSASAESFGHSGFTGTYTWADPANKLVFVFLSNRVNPRADNNKLSKMNIRTKVMEAFYEALDSVEKK
jgi:beta-glucosidase-like glycosyl hydrolase/CubicO group peptidase (beta-lactamase class C family)